MLGTKLYAVFAWAIENIVLFNFEGHLGHFVRKKQMTKRIASIRFDGFKNCFYRLIGPFSSFFHPFWNFLFLFFSLPLPPPPNNDDSMTPSFGVRRGSIVVIDDTYNTYIPPKCVATNACRCGWESGFRIYAASPHQHRSKPEDDES